MLLSEGNLYAQRVGLVLSGGGARGLAHIGVIKALEEHHIPIDYIAGTSAGAIVGCMYALGFSPDQMDSIVNTDEFYSWATGIIDDDYQYYFLKPEENASWITLKFSLDSAFQTSLPTNIVSSVPYDYALMENTAQAIAKAGYNFDSLFIPFRCVAADIENKKTIVFRKGDLATAVRASSAYPFYFKPVYYDGKILYDGGMYNNFPADVMLHDFQPDIIIGVNASGTTTPTSENNIISQIRAMMTTPTSFSVLCDNGILIEVDTDPFGLFDFTRINELIKAGHDAAMQKMDRIETYVQRRSNPMVLMKKRKAFRYSDQEVAIDKLTIEGINGKQADYVRRIIKPSINPLPIARLKPSYFQLVADQNIKSIYPTLKFNPLTGYYDLNLRIARENDLITQFGGNLTSRPVSEAFVGLQYRVWDRTAYTFTGNVYFGKLYTSGQLSARMDIPSHHPYFVEAIGTLNQYDFFRSSTAFFADQKPAYIITSDYNFGINAGVPARNKGKVVLSGSYLRNADNYYQTQNFLQKDTADESILNGINISLTFERNTLNKKQYANQGTFLRMRIRYVNINEYTIPGSTSIDRKQRKEFHDWFTFKILYDNYFKKKGKLKFGFYFEGAASDMPFLANYTATILNSPSFEPIPEMQTIFLPAFRSQVYAAAGLKNLFMLTNSIDIRLEGYIFMPYQEYIRTPDLKTEFGKTFANRYYTGSFGAVFHSPIGPVGLFLNYYDKQKNPFSFMIHLGYFIFNPGSMD